MESVITPSTSASQEEAPRLVLKPLRPRKAKAGEPNRTTLLNGMGIVAFGFFLGFCGMFFTLIGGASAFNKLLPWLNWLLLGGLGIQAVALYLLGFGGIVLLALARVGASSAFISSNVLHSGQNFTVELEQYLRQGAPIRSIELSLVLREEVRYKRKRFVIEHPIEEATIPVRKHAGRVHLREQCTFVLPPDEGDADPSRATVTGPRQWVIKVHFHFRPGIDIWREFLLPVELESGRQLDTPQASL